MGALSLLETLHEQQVALHHVLDMGCGAGTLSIQAAHWWPQCRITAADISAKAISDTTQHIAAANLTPRVTALRSDGYSEPAVKAKAPYDLIISNLLADHHVRFAREAKAHLAPGGLLILSGILAWLMPHVRECYTQLGMEILAETEIGEWRALLLHNQ